MLGSRYSYTVITYSFQKCFEHFIILLKYRKYSINTELSYKSLNFTISLYLNIFFCTEGVMKDWDALC